MRPPKLFWLCVLLPALSLMISCRKSSPADVYAPVITKLEAAISYEMADKQLPALGIVLVDDQTTVWEKAFGQENPATQKGADLETIYRIGSVSKLFTDIAVMQLVEQDKIDLDVPVQTYLPDFKPHNPFSKPITLRQLMSHRAGLIREPRVGHYFDDTDPTLAATVASLNESTLVHAPESQTKYSNAGIAVVGYVLEKVMDKPFADYLQTAVLNPIGLKHSAFAPTPAITQHLASGEMWSYDGRVFPAPTFELGMAPAGSMYATIGDLGQFLQVLFNGGQGKNGPVLQSETLQRMWEPQYPNGSTRNYGIGFRLDEQEGHRRVGHGGAIYGFATQLYALPDDKLGAAVVITADGANTISERLSAYALDLMLAHRAGRPLPDYPQTTPIDPAQRTALEGNYYTADGQKITLEDRSTGLTMLFASGEARLKASGDSLLRDDRNFFGPGLRFLNPDEFQFEQEYFKRRRDSLPPPSPNSEFAGLIGEYGWNFNVLIIYEEQGQLYSLIEWFFKYPLTKVGPDTYAFPEKGGLYAGEQLHFTRDASGKATQVELVNSVVFPRRQNIDAAETFRIQPLATAADLLPLALKAALPAEPAPAQQPELVELVSLDPSIKLDIRYATTNNFMGAVFYQQARAFMQRPAAEALARAHAKLKTKGYGLLIYDAYRPWYVTKMFWDATPEDKKIFVADPAKGSRHNRGCAVDLTLYDLKTGKPVTMTAGYDEMTERSYPFYVGGTSQQRWLRSLLRETMEAEGFTVYDFEWWHFDYSTWSDFPIMNVRFEEM